MSETLSRISGKGRGFVNKHILKRKTAAPARPQAAAPVAPPAALAAAAIVLPSAAQPAEPRAAVAKRRSSLDQAGNDAGEGGFDAGRALPDQAGNDSPEALDTGDSSPAMPPAILGQPAQMAERYAKKDHGTYGIPNFGEESSSEEERSSKEERSSEEEPDFEEQYRAPKKHAVVSAEASPTGMKTKSIGAEYAGEFQKNAWRGGGKGPGAERTDIVTRMYSEEEQKQNALTMDKNGAFKRGGRGVEGETAGYAMDGSGRMVAFDENTDILATTDSAGAVTKEETSDGRAIRSGLIKPGPGERLEMPHHSTALGGEAVPGEDGKPVLDAAGEPVMQARQAASAGFVSFDFDGKIVKISNCSGHYKPGVDFLIQAVEHLLVQGAFFEGKVTDAQGRTLNSKTKEGQLYEATQARLAEAAKMADRVTDLTAALQSAEAKGDEKAQAALGTTLNDLGAKLAALTKKIGEAKAVLGKLGVGPSNRVRRDASAEFVDTKQGMTGLDVRTRPTKEMQAYEFLKTGGGNITQAKLKSDLGREILARSKLGRDDRTKLEALTAKDTPLTKEEAKELTRLKTAWDNAVEDAAAEQRTKQAAAGAGAGSPPDIEGALKGLGVRLQDHGEVENGSQSEYDSVSNSESESETESSSMSR